MENRKKGLPTPDPHVDGGNGVKIIVYNSKKNSKKGGQEKKTRKKKEREREQKVEEIQQ